MKKLTYLQPGKRIYYTGDQANQDSWGTIINVRPADKWGPESVDISFDDERFEGDNERLSRGIYVSMFEPGPGQRFYTATDWQAKRDQQIKVYEKCVRKAKMETP